MGTFNAAQIANLTRRAEIEAAGRPLELEPERLRLEYEEYELFDLDPEDLSPAGEAMARLLRGGK